MDNSLKDTNLFLLKRSRDLLRRNAEYKETESSAKRIYLSLNDATKTTDFDVCIVTNDLPSTDQLAFVKYLAEHVRKDSSKVYAYAGYRFNYTKNGAITPVQKITRFDRRPFVARYKDNDNKEEVVDVFTGETFACSGKVLKEILSAKQAGTSNEVISVSCAELGVPIVCILPKRDWSGQPYRKSSNEVIAVFDTDEHSTVFSYKGWGREKKLEALSTATEVKAEGPSDPESVAVIITTHNRTETAKITIESLVKRLKYPKIHWFIADDRSDPGHVQQLVDKFAELGVSDVHVTETNEEHWGLGASLNNALTEAFKLTDVVLTTEDDWYLQYDFDISSHVSVLRNNEDVCTIRLGAVNTVGQCLTEAKIEGYKTLSKEKYKYERDRKRRIGFAFNLQVALRHKRLYDALGLYIENKHSDIVEADFNKRFIGAWSNFIWLWPDNLDDRTLCNNTNPFLHIGESTVGHAHPVAKPFDVIRNTRFRLITAVKNSINTIERCCNSVLQQSYKDIKWIIVDDSSSDGSYEFLKELEKDYPDLIEVRKNNGIGMGSAWNTGLVGCEREDYVLFLDSDDYFIDSRSVSDINYTIMSHPGVDCILLSYVNELAKHDVIFTASSVKEAMQHHASAPWSKCVRSSLYANDDCKFPTNKRCCNDTVQDLCLFTHVNTVVSINTPVVFYSKSGPNSVWNNLEHGKIPPSRLDAIDSVCRTIDELKRIKFDNKYIDEVRIKKSKSLERYIPSTYKKIDTCIMTCIFGDYDVLREPARVDGRFEYICVTDNSKLKSSTWKIVTLDKYQEASSMFKTYYVKHHPFEFTTCDTCFFVDASMQLMDSSITRLADDFKRSECSIGIIANNYYKTLNDEIKYWSNLFSSATSNKHFSKNDEASLRGLIDRFGAGNHRSCVNGGIKLFKNDVTTSTFNDIAWALLKSIPSDGLDICRLDQPILSLILEFMIPNEKVFVMTREIYQGSPFQIYEHGTFQKRKPLKIDYDDIWFSNRKIKPYRLAK